MTDDIDAWAWRFAHDLVKADAADEKPVVTNIPAGVDIFATRPLPHGLRYAPARPPSAGEVFLFRRQEAQ